MAVAEAALEPAPPTAAPLRRVPDAAASAALARAAVKAAPVVLAREQSLPVAPALVPLLPDGLRRGSVVSIDGGPGTTTMALALASAASAQGSWTAVVGAPSMGLAAAAELGLAPERLLVVPAPAAGAGTTVATVVAALLDAVDVVLLGSRLSMSEARRLLPRARERGAVVIGLPGRWPLAADVSLTTDGVRWEAPSCRLAARLVEVVATGRAAASRPRRASLWLPGPDGSVTPALPVPGAAEAAQRLQPHREAEERAAVS